jgi:hypothetical protein
MILINGNNSMGCCKRETVFRLRMMTAAAAAVWGAWEQSKRKTLTEPTPSEALLASEHETKAKHLCCLPCTLLVCFLVVSFALQHAIDGSLWTFSVRFSHTLIGSQPQETLENLSIDWLVRTMIYHASSSLNLS